MPVLAQIAIFAGLFFLISGPVHECAHAYTAWRLGDGTAKLFGRVTLNPIAHFDPMGGVVLLMSAYVGFGFGWAKPTPVNPYNLRGRYGDTLVAAAGPLSNLALAIVFAAAFRAIPDQIVNTGSGLAYFRSPAGIASLICYLAVNLNVALFVFNLLPIPPLDGSHVLYDVLDRRTVMQIRPFLDQYGMFILIAAVILPILPGGLTLVSWVFLHVGDPIVTFLTGL